MYENIKYSELRELPEDQKKIALQELMEKYGSNKGIAEATGAALIAIANMYNSVVLGKHVGRVTGSKNATKEELKQQEQKTESRQETSIITEAKPKRQYTRKPKEESTLKLVQPVEESKSEVLEPQKQESIYTITFAGELQGEEAKERITSLANTLLKSKEYAISVKITEK